PDVIICIDACFTQKLNRQVRDPPRTHPHTVFIPEADAEAMEKHVEFIRSKRAHSIKKPNTEEPDHFKGSLHVPKSVLDGCKAGFTAVDSRHDKASMQFFDDTALMVLLCRHDVVLFITNMQSAGEKQHYVMVLVETLFQHLPLPYRVGLLYDIGCQTERSCIKWNFLDCYIEQISFGISIFYTFGHQWVCQLIYHPRKRTGFRLSDGEGCERFWHSIRKDAVKELLQLHKTQDGLKKWEHEYDVLVEDEATPMDEYMEVKANLESVCLHLQELATRIQNKQSILGVTDHAQLKNLTNNPFLTARMNALALKQRLHDQLRARKFKMEHLECSFHKQVNASSIKQHKPAITKVARSFNVLCDTMEDLFNKGKAPPSTICPKKLEIKGIFALNVDDAIWEDLRLDEGSPVAPPPWLSDEGVQAGIRALLELFWMLWMPLVQGQKTTSICMMIN
ncbi:hypothetical protein DXG01_001310, partial [Tephrocybe rancida]